MTETKTVRRLPVIVAFVALSSALLLAQSPPSFADSQKANAGMLRQSTWKSRTELKLKGESKNIKLEQVRYDLNGALQKTALTPPPAAAPPPSGRGGRLKKKIVDTKKEEFAEMMQGLGQLAGSYAHLPPDKLQAFKTSATKARGTGAMEGTAQVLGLNVLLPGDSVTIWIDPPSQAMRRVEIKTLYENKPATVVIDYRSIPNGPTYAARTVLAYPEKKVELTVDNYDYAPSQP
jgi:hypothetical protein